MFEQKKDVLFFPDSFKKPGDFRETNKTNVLMRTETLSRLVASNTTGELLVTYPEALFEKVVNTRILQKNTIHIAVNERVNLQFIIELLVEYGFERSDFVYEPGQFSWRGGIVDIYSFGNDLPYRIELFGEEVESIRIFDPLTQLSVRKVQQINIVPNIQTQFSVTEKTSLLQLLPKNTAIWVSNPKTMYQINQFCYEKAVAFAQNRAQEVANFPDSESLFLDENALDSFISSEQLFSDLQRFNILELSSENYFPTSQTYHFSATNQPAFHKNFQILIKDLKDKEHDRFDTFLLISNPKQVERLHAIFEDLKADVVYLPLLISVYRGFVDYDLKIACYTDHQIFDRYYKYHIKQGYSKDKALTIKLLRELQPGDYVTHIDHGVGIFAGLERIDVMGKPQEAVRLVYKDNDVLYVSVQSLHKISKYAGSESKVPKIHKLGSDAWENTKRKIKTQIKVLAFDLIKVYAKRKATKGFVFSPDTYLQTEVEASFEYEDTPDQLR
ncbi:MAG TPA: CarD family transcriptional regulator, partial [Chitinophagales bacterium]|nr:CarD family transcriptional regulator [Chitinophagales bacterium]